MSRIVAGNLPATVPSGGSGLGWVSAHEQLDCVFEAFGKLEYPLTILFGHVQKKPPSMIYGDGGLERNAACWILSRDTA